MIPRTLLKYSQEKASRTITVREARIYAFFILPRLRQEEQS